MQGLAQEHTARPFLILDFSDGQERGQNQAKHVPTSPKVQMLGLVLLLLLLLLLSLRIPFPSDSNTESDDTCALSLDQLMKNRYGIGKQGHGMKNSEILEKEVGTPDISTM